MDRRHGRAGARLSQRGVSFGLLLFAVAASSLLLACATSPRGGEGLRVERIEDAVLPMATAAVAAGQLETARRLYTRLLEVDADSVDARMGLGDVALISQETAQAATWYLAAVAHADQGVERHDALLAHARAALATGDLEAARSSFSRLTATRENATRTHVAWAYNGIGLVSLFEGDPRAAVAAMEQAVLRMPNEAMFQANLERALTIVANYRPAEQPDAEEEMQAAPRSPGRESPRSEAARAERAPAAGRRRAGEVPDEPIAPTPPIADPPDQPIAPEPPPIADAPPKAREDETSATERVPGTAAESPAEAGDPAPEPTLESLKEAVSGQVRPGRPTTAEVTPPPAQAAGRDHETVEPVPPDEPVAPDIADESPSQEPVPEAQPTLDSLEDALHDPPAPAPAEADVTESAPAPADSSPEADASRPEDTSAPPDAPPPALPWTPQAFGIRTQEGDYLQVGAYADEARAEATASRLRGVTDLTVRVRAGTAGDDSLFRVQIGPLPPTGVPPELVSALGLDATGSAPRAPNRDPAGEPPRRVVENGRTFLDFGTYPDYERAAAAAAEARGRTGGEVELSKLSMGGGPPRYRVRVGPIDRENPLAPPAAEAVRDQPARDEVAEPGRRVVENGRTYLEIGTYADYDRAATVADEMRRRTGHDVELSKVSMGGGQSRYRVRLGPIDDGDPSPTSGVTEEASR